MGDNQLETVLLGFPHFCVFRPPSFSLRLLSRARINRHLIQNGHLLAFELFELAQDLR